MAKPGPCLPVQRRGAKQAKRRRHALVDLAEVVAGAVRAHDRDRVLRMCPRPRGGGGQRCHELSHRLSVHGVLFHPRAVGDDHELVVARHAILVDREHRRCQAMRPGLNALDVLEATCDRIDPAREQRGQQIEAHRDQVHRVGGDTGRLQHRIDIGGGRGASVHADRLAAQVVDRVNAAVGARDDRVQRRGYERGHRSHRDLLLSGVEHLRFVRDAEVGAVGADELDRIRHVGGCQRGDVEAGPGEEALVDAGVDADVVGVRVPVERQCDLRRPRGRRVSRRRRSVAGAPATGGK